MNDEEQGTPTRIQPTGKAAGTCDDRRKGVTAESKQFNAAIGKR